MPRYRKEQHYNITLPPFFDNRKKPHSGEERGSLEVTIEFYDTIILYSKGHVKDTFWTL